MHIGQKSYLFTRLAEAGIQSDEISRYGLSSDENGNILQLIRHFDGTPYTYLTSEGKRVEKHIRANKTLGSDATDLENYTEPLFLTRYAPKVLTELRSYKPKTGKYKFPSKAKTGYGALPLPTPRAIDAFNGYLKGGSVVFTEGALKAYAMDVYGIEAVAFSGIGNFKLLQEETKEYIIRRTQDELVFLYDGDGLYLKNKPSDKRVRDFKRSAEKAITDYFDIAEQMEWNPRSKKIWVAMLNPNLKAKAIDDLLHERPNEKEAILSDFYNRVDGEYFRFKKVTKTTYKKRLESFFGLSNYREFHRLHAKELGTKPFIFNGVTYRKEERTTHGANLFNNGTRDNFHMVNNPHRIEIEAEVVNIGKYISECTSKLNSILCNKSKVCIEAPTGSGKTALFTGYTDKGKKVKGYFTRTNQKGIIAVPTKNLCEQIASKNKNVVAVHGNASTHTLEKAINSLIVVCTYDSLYKLHDLNTRILVVDEAHNLINQNNFRAEVLRYVLESFNIAKQAVLISGTPPRILSNLLGFHYVEVKRKENNQVVVHQIESEKNSIQSLTTTALNQIEKGKDDKLQFVFYNNTAQLELTRDTLVKRGVYKKSEIEIITRKHYDNGESRVLNHIIKAELVNDDVKLVLSSCLIAEGVNINNTNIGKVYMVNPTNVDTFRQYVARFRKMATLHVYSIKIPEQKVLNGFQNPLNERVLDKKDMASIQARNLTRELEAHKEAYGAEYYPFMDEIEPQYNYNTVATPYAYVNKKGKVKVDFLRIIHEAKTEVENQGNNCFFYTQLSEFDNIYLSGAEDVTIEDGVEDSLNEVEAENESRKAETTEQLKQDLLSKPSILVGAYYLVLKKANNKRAKWMEQNVGGLLNDLQESKVYLDTNKEHFKHRWFNEIIISYCKLSAIGVEAEVIRNEIECFNPHTFSIKWRQFKRLGFNSMYDNRRKRQLLSAAHKIDIKALRKIKEVMEANMDVEGCIQSENAYKIARNVFRKYELSKDLDGVKEVRMVNLSESKIESILNELFTVEIERKVRGKVYRLLDLELPFTLNTPPRVMDDLTRLIDVVFC